MTCMTEDVLRVPGAGLYYRTRGSGPLLLLVQGGGGDAGGTGQITVHLERGHTVLTYDRRGLSRSVLDDPDEVPSIDTHADDVHRLLGSLTTEPVPVFGTSFGAFVGLELIARHPAQVSLLVAHEPPVRQFLPEAALARFQTLQGRMEAAVRRGESTDTLAVEMGMDFGEREPGVEFGPSTDQDEANARFFRTRDVPSLDGHLLDVEALAAARARIVPAVGATSGEAYAGRCTAELAAALGVDVVEFPGSHVGLSTHPRAFAAQLERVLA
jgi:pimeloyl-ACP methyl ester carboxylesterase